jgi:DNA replication and repair protein RecF
MKTVYLERINAENYRNFSNIAIEFKNGINIIIGSNGSGKTNILESISLLSPGKGLKSAHFNDVRKHDTLKWTTNFKLKSKLGVAEIVSLYSKGERSRKILYNGSKISGNELSNLLNVMWLTPQMEGLFLGSSTARRKFLDRIVFSFDANHAKNIAKYDYYMRERNKSLVTGNLNSQDSWLSTLEHKMAESAEIIANARKKIVELMQDSINGLDTEFPKAELFVTEIFDSKEHWNDFILNYMNKLKGARQKDFYSGRANFGVHKADLNVFHKEKSQPAKLCSTGEQKALLISIVLSSIDSVVKNTQTTPILLLDELFVHLDGSRKNHLAEYIMQSKLQTFITSTDIVGIEYLAANAHIIEL